MKKGIKQKIIEILQKIYKASEGKFEDGSWFEETADEILELFEEEKKKWIEEILEKLPKEKIRPLESFADKKIGAEYEHYKKGYNDCLKDIKLTGEKYQHLYL